MDVYRGEDGSYHVEADLPGAHPDSVEVTVEHGVLTIQAGRTPHYGDSGQVIVAERPQGSFGRQLSLDEEWTRKTSPLAQHPDEQNEGGSAPLLTELSSRAVTSGERAARPSSRMFRGRFGRSL